MRTLGASDPQRAGAALGELCEIYWYPIYAFIRRSGHSPVDAEDHTQSFFVELLRRDDFQKADPDCGKLRSYLMGAAKHFLSRQRDKDRALRRGGGVVPVSIDQARAEEIYALEPVDDVTPESLYERRWAMTLLQRAMGSLRKQYEARDKQKDFEMLVPFLSWNSGESYEQTAAALGNTVGRTKVAVHRLRKRYRAALVQEIADTVSDESEVQDELTFIFTVFA